MLRQDKEDFWCFHLGNKPHTKKKLLKMRYHADNRVDFIA